MAGQLVQMPRYGQSLQSGSVLGQTSNSSAVPIQEQLVHAMRRVISAMVDLLARVQAISEATGTQLVSEQSHLFMSSLLARLRGICNASPGFSGPQAY